MENRRVKVLAVKSNGHAVFIPQGHNEGDFTVVSPSSPILKAYPAHYPNRPFPSSPYTTARPFKPSRLPFFSSFTRVTRVNAFTKGNSLGFPHL